jgi:WD40 repeat protein
MRASGLAFSADGQSMTASGRILEVRTGRQFATLKTDSERVFGPWASGSVLFTPDAKSIVSWINQDVCVWETSTGKILRRIVAPQLIFSMAIAPDGRFVAGALREGHSIRLWHLASGRKVAELHGPADVSPTLAFSPDGRFLAAGSGDYTRSTERSVRLCELASGREVRRFEGHRAGVTKVAFLPNGRSLVSSSADATVVVWDVTGLGRERPLRDGAGSPADVKALWSDLAGDDAPKANRAIWTMAALVERAVPFLAERLRPIGADDADKDTSLGPIASGETLRRLRAIAVLERAGTADAKRILERLASGLEGARETRDAKASLRRLGRK